MSKNISENLRKAKTRQNRALIMSIVVVIISVFMLFADPISLYYTPFLYLVAFPSVLYFGYTGY